MLITPEEISKFDFTPYGRYLSRPGNHPCGLDTGYSLCWPAEYTFPMGEMRFGIEQARYRAVLSIPKMEQHRESKELVICGDQPVVLPLCLPRDRNDRMEHPRMEDVRAVILRPGDTVVLDEYIWHAGCMPLVEDTFYLFAYQVRDEELYWRTVEHGPIELRLGGVQA